MLKWPERARLAIRKLFEPLQPIDIYVEDTNDEPFYRALLNKIAQDRITIARVFGLGGREAVITAARRHNYSQRRALFIIDGDLEWVQNLPMPAVAGLHRHAAYCIENLLFHEKALVQILSQEAVLTEDDAINRLDLSTWIASIQNPLLELFAAFATVNHFDPEVKTVSQRVGQLCVCPPGGIPTLDSTKVAKARDSALAAAEIMTDKETVRAFYDETLARIEAITFPLDAVSGKDYLLPLISFRFQFCGCRIKTKSLRMRMASLGDKRRFSDLFSSLQLAASG